MVGRRDALYRIMAATTGSRAWRALAELGVGFPQLTDHHQGGRHKEGLAQEPGIMLQMGID